MSCSKREAPDEGGWLSARPPTDPPPLRVHWPGISVERAWLHPLGPTSFAFEGTRLMLRLGEAGRRLDGETFLSDGTRSTARAMADRLHVCPPGMRLWGWSRPGGAWAYTAVYLDTAPFEADRIAALRPMLAARLPAATVTLRKLAALAQEGARDRLHAETLALLLVLELGAHPNARPARGGISPATLRRVQAMMQDRLAEDLPLGELAAVAGLSPWHFCRAFREATGLPPHRWLAARRMERARDLLAAGSQPITEIAPAVGYGGVTQFSAAFRRHTGLTPSAFRRAIGGTAR